MDTVDLDEDRYHVAATASLTAGGTRVLKDGDTFALVNRFGDVHRAGGNEQGLFCRGTRFLSRLELRVAGRRPLFLSSGMLDDNIVLAVDLSNPDLETDQDGCVAPYGTLHISRSLLVRDGLLLEQISISNHGSTSVRVPLSVHFAADFVDLFEVRGTVRARHGELLSPTLDRASAVLGYRGLDQVRRSARIELEPTPERLEPGAAHFSLELASKETREILVRVACEIGEEPATNLPSFEEALGQASAASRGRLDRECLVQSSNDRFNAWLERSRSDLHMLSTSTPYGLYPYAGVPWFSTPFGRDGIWTALSTL
jgi:glycogen debranching enzyme